MKQKGGKRPGAGRKPRSLRPEKRITLAERFYELRCEFATEGAPNPVEAAEDAMFDADHPDGEREPGDKDRYRDALKKSRSRGRSEDMFLGELDAELATEQDPGRRNKVIKQLDDLGLGWRRRHSKR